VNDRTAARWIGGIIGFLIAGYFWAYVPMKRNYEECGRITLCSAPDSGEKP
jgi:hypothetical protein